MGTTNRLNLRYPEPTDAPNAPQQFRNLAEDVEGFLAPVVPATGSAWTTFTPTFNTSGVAANLGAGATLEGAYTKIGRTVLGRFNLVWGTTGLQVGSGHFLFGLPVPAKFFTGIENIVAGHGLANHSPGPAEVATLTAVITSTTQVVLRSELAYLVGAVFPYAWGAGMAIRFQFTYEAAS